MNRYFRGVRGNFLVFGEFKVKFSVLGVMSLVNIIFNKLLEMIREVGYLGELIE